MQRALLLVDMSNFNQRKTLKSLQIWHQRKLGWKLFSDQKEIFNISIKTRSHIEYLL